MSNIGDLSSGGKKPTTPTIGTPANAGAGEASVFFTASTYIGKGTVTYTATSDPGGITATGSSSPILVSGLTPGTSYTFTVKATTDYGVDSDVSSVSAPLNPPYFPPFFPPFFPPYFPPFFPPFFPPYFPPFFPPFFPPYFPPFFPPFFPPYFPPFFPPFFPPYFPPEFLPTCSCGCQNCTSGSRYVCRNGCYYFQTYYLQNCVQTGSCACPACGSEVITSETFAGTCGACSE